MLYQDRPESCPNIFSERKRTERTSLMQHRDQSIAGILGVTEDEPAVRMSPPRRCGSRGFHPCWGLAGERHCQHQAPTRFLCLLPPCKRLRHPGERAVHLTDSLNIFISAKETMSLPIILAKLCSAGPGAVRREL